VRELLRWLHESNWDAGASVFGVAITIVGFAVTLFQVARSKSAAEGAEEAAADVRKHLALQTVAADLASLMSDIEEMKQLHRDGYWALMPVRYSAVRRKLLGVKASCPTLTRTQRSSITGVIDQFKDIEEIVERAIASPRKAPTDVAALNKLAAEQSDKLTEVLVAVQQEMKNK
jgi:hypothetical protein